MRTVVRTAPGEVQLNWMWLPTWIGMDTRLKAEIEKALAPKFVGQELDEGLLDLLNEEVISFLDNRFPGIELREYLESLKFITET